jgi:hypothetical protein
MVVPGGDGEARFFGAGPRQGELRERYAGQFAVVCGRRLLGVHSSLEGALRAAADAFDSGLVEDGAPILVNEISDNTRVRAVAEPR